MLMMILVSTFTFHHVNDPKKDLAFDAIYKIVLDEFMAAVFDTQNAQYELKEEDFIVSCSENADWIFNTNQLRGKILNDSHLFRSLK